MRAVLAALTVALTACGSTGGHLRPSATPTPPTSPATSTTSTHPTPTTPQPPSPTRTSTTAPHAVTLPAAAYVTVAVATVWRSPSSPRPVDQRALTAPVDIRGWLAAMTLDQRRDLQGRADTQVLLDDRVLVVALQPGWAQVRVPDQPTPLNVAGYPGWVPRAQLAFTAPTAGPLTATVVARTAWLQGGASVEVSFGTRLPVRARTATAVTVALPEGRSALARAQDVVVAPSGAPARPPTGADVVRTARQFLGLPYLWAGTSGFGFDCSGLTYLDYRVHGRVIPRDADAQAATGAAVARAALVAGDLIFFGTASNVHHVGVYAGSGTMVDAPQTGGVVETVPVTHYGDYWAARRYLG